MNEQSMAKEREIENHYQFPMTVKQASSANKKFIVPTFEEDFNNISIIKDSTNHETTQFMEEQSFNQELLKKLQDFEPVLGNIDKLNEFEENDDNYSNDDEAVAANMEEEQHEY